MTDLARHRFATRFGPVEIAATERGLTRVRLCDPAEEASETPGDAAPPPALAEAERLLRAYFDGVPVDFATLALDTTALGPLEAAIYDALRRVPRGATVTYGELARRVGAPKAAQAVGRAMARNPWPIVVPCHRVLAGDGSLGGFSAPGGVATKRRLLALEGVDLTFGMPHLPGLFDES